ncbi:5 TM domain-containing transmembrane protein [Acrasis kona]|uniref:5 TM domain-containing transmembrane protein n=1 Tax=Acrasis kona TaxID=1008807 RepID=A0AAW2ZD87_9EUKA
MRNVLKSLYLVNEGNPGPIFTDTEWLWTFLGIVFHTFCYQVVAPKISRLSETYRFMEAQHEKLQDVETERSMAEWNSRVVSTIHALIVSTLGIYSVLYEGVIVDFKLYHVTPISDIATSFMLGYILYDLILVLKWWPDDYGMIAHHFTAATMHVGVLCYDIVVLELGYVISEISTPFLNNRYFLDKSNSRGTLYMINGIIIWILFFIVRIIILLPLVPSMHFFHPDDFAEYIPFGVGAYMYILYATISSLNVFWFYRITLGMIKAIKGRPKSPKHKLN